MLDIGRLKNLVGYDVGLFLLPIEFFGETKIGIGFVEVIFIEVYLNWLVKNSNRKYLSRHTTRRDPVGHAILHHLIVTRES